MLIPLPWLRRLRDLPYWHPNCCLLAQVLVEIPYVVIQAIMYSLVIYSMVGFEWTAVKFFWFLYVLFFSLISFTYYGMMMVAITPNTQLATISGAFFYSLFNLFSGFLIFRPVSSSTLASKITKLPKGGVYILLVLHLVMYHVILM